MVGLPSKNHVETAKSGRGLMRLISPIDYAGEAENLQAYVIILG